MFLLLLLLLTIVLSQAWDGVVITQPDFQGLQTGQHSFKQGLVDPFNYLQSWTARLFMRSPTHGLVSTVCSERYFLSLMCAPSALALDDAPANYFLSMRR